MRRPKANTTKGAGRGQLVAMVNISQGPAEFDDRAVPGHGEGDLVFGTGRSGIATLVERSGRFVMLVALAGATSETSSRRSPARC